MRDAQALYALFCDTFFDLDGRLLTDQTASLASIKEHLDEALTRSTPEDVVVVFFAGHGTPEHQLVPYDTDSSNFTASTLAMQELADKFRGSSARAILCIIDCCFSGAAPARVIKSAPRSRGGIFSYESFDGKGRFLLAAASPTEPAWEEPGTGHGLLTKAIIEVFTSGTDPVDITAAVAEIVSKTKAYAQHIGEQQNPSFVGSVEGKLELPALRRGDRWYEFFPELHKIAVGRAISALSVFNIPDEVLKAWEARYKDGLNALQLEAVNSFRVLDGNSLLVIAPTSSGKTFIGEMSAIRAAVENRKAVFLLPYRALVNEKYEDFLNIYSPLGLRVVRCSGDFSDDVSLFLSGRYDIALLTFEMFLTLSVASPHILKRLGLVVVDEAQFITDPTRGISIELLLTLLCAGRQQGLRPQLIALSAVIGGINGFDEWLGAKHLFWKERPVPLTEGVLDRSGIYQSIDRSGNEREVQLIPSPSYASGHGI